jgi:hypothetical protein
MGLYNKILSQSTATSVPEKDHFPEEKDNALAKLDLLPEKKKPLRKHFRPKHPYI